MSRARTALVWAAASSFLAISAGASAEDGSVCASATDEDEQTVYLQQSVLARAANGAVQPSPFNEDGAGSVRRAQVRTLGGLCAQDPGDQACPAECPLIAKDVFAQAPGGNPYCNFVCVPATEAACVAFSPGDPIPDTELGICRTAAKDGCHEYVPPSATSTAGQMERCAVCSSGYHLLEDGTCQSNFRYIWYTFFLGLGIFLLAIGAWLVDLARRPIINHAGLEHGLATRSRAKLHTPNLLEYDENGPTPRGSAGGDSRRELWPLTTNLCRTVVAGPGLTLHFNYMAMITMWAGCVALAWIAFAYFVDDGEGVLFELGTRVAATPRETCSIVDQGHKMQQKFMGANAAFVAGVYVCSFALFVAFSFYQKRLLVTLDKGEATHMDFCAVLEGLPSMSGDAKVEDELCEEIEKATGHKPVGVSIAWDMGELHQQIMSTIDENLDTIHHTEWAAEIDHGSMRLSRAACAMEQSLSGGSRGREGRKSISKESRRSIRGARASIKNVQRLGQDSSFWRLFLMQIERAWLSPTVQRIITKGRRRDFQGRHNDNFEVDEDFDIDEELLTMRSCNTAYAVFESKDARDEAVANVSKTGSMSFQNASVTMRRAKHEPQAVIWTNFKDQHVGWKVFRCVCGALAIVMALFLWTLVFYLPYAYYAMSFNYGQGQWPGMMKETTFVIIIVCGNATMYYLCSIIADWCGFRYAGDRELCYTLLYYVSCLLNVVLDMVCAYKVAFMALVGVGSATHDGVLLQDLSSFVSRFDSYPVQLELGWTVFAYAFPCTFLLPFIAEPIATIAMPYKIMTAIVGYRHDIQGSRADTFLSCTPMDLSRYADIALNVVLATLVFWFPSGITLTMFVSIALSHVYIFMYDHYRVLRAVPAFTISGMRTDWWAQVMLTVPCGLLLACALYKANCVEGFERFHPSGVLAHASRDIFGHCKQGEMLVWKCVAALAVHVVVHLVILTIANPLLGGRTARQRKKTTYAECAMRNAHSYFSVNPVHCLRSEYFYQHEPSFVFSRAGKEHLMPQNYAIGAYFSDSYAKTEDFSNSVNPIQGLKMLQNSLS